MKNLGIQIALLIGLVSGAGLFALIIFTGYKLAVSNVSIDLFSGI
jgi:hypothetical protein